MRNSTLAACLAAAFVVLPPSVRAQQASVPTTDVLDEIPSSAAYPRNSEGSFIALEGGRIAFYYSQFYGGENDFAASRISEIHTDDGGRTWSAPRVVIPNDPVDVNIMSISLLRLLSGKIAMVYCLTRTEIDSRPVLRISNDEGATWSEARAVVQAPGPGEYYYSCNDRLIETHRGRLYLPVTCNRVVKPGDAAIGTGPDGAGASIDWRGIMLWYYSDDDGRNWQESPTWWTLPAMNAAGELSPNGLVESGIVERADGTLYSWARSDQGSQFACIGHDSGNVAIPLFGEPKPSELQSPFSPANIKRIPGSGDLLAVWNDHSGRFPFSENPKDNIQGRTPLVVGISADGGKTWPVRKVLEGDRHGQFSYPSIFFTGSDAWIAYDVELHGAPHLGTLRIRRVPLTWVRN